MLNKLESPLCNVVDRVGSIVGERCKVKGSEETAIVVASQVQAPVVSGPSWESRFPRALGLALLFKLLYTLQIRETFAKEGALGPINLFDWKRVGLLIMYLCCHHPFLCSPP